MDSKCIFKINIDEIALKLADDAINHSSTYVEAILLVKKTISSTELGLALKKTIQDEITRRALDSECKL